MKDLIPEHYEYYRDWFHAAIRGMVRKGNTRNVPLEIATSLVPVITEEQAIASIMLLKRLSFIAENEVGELVAVDVEETDGDNPIEKVYQEQMAQLATQSIFTQDSDSQGFESVTLSLPPEQVAELKDRIRAWAADLSKEDGEAEKGVCIS